MMAARLLADDRRQVAIRSIVAPVLATDEVDRHAVRLVTIDPKGVSLRSFAELPALLRAGDLVVVNDAATLPASFHGRVRGVAIELRLSGPVIGRRLDGILFGAGDYRTRTEDRAAPPSVASGDRIIVGAITGTIVRAAGRRVAIDADLDGDALWDAIYASGVAVQYAHRPAQLPLYAVQTAYATRPWSVEMPSAGRPLTWDVILGLRRAGIPIATLTHAAGLSSTGDPALDAAMPWPERYEIPEDTARMIVATRARGGRVIAIGTTVARALEASRGLAGSGVATLRLDPAYVPAIVDGIVSGLHVPGESHFELLGMLAPRARLLAGLQLASAHGLSSHELGDSCLVVR